jgi:hypothetical protein
MVKQEGEYICDFSDSDEEHNQNMPTFKSSFKANAPQITKGIKKSNCYFKLNIGRFKNMRPSTCTKSTLKDTGTTNS